MILHVFENGHLDIQLREGGNSVKLRYQDFDTGVVLQAPAGIKALGIVFPKDATYIGSDGNLYVLYAEPPLPEEIVYGGPRPIKLQRYVLDTGTITTYWGGEEEGL